MTNTFEWKDFQCELFLFEAPKNHQPPPPDGWFAMRSNKRRIFLRLDNGSVPTPDKVNEMINAGEFEERPL